MARVNPLSATPAGRFEPESSNAVAEEPSQRRDLVRVEPANSPQAPHLAHPRPQAAFLAHLLAVAHRAPQMQEKRRAEPQDAISRYAAAGQAAPVSPGRSLKRAV